MGCCERESGPEAQSRWKGENEPAELAWTHDARDKPEIRVFFFSYPRGKLFLNGRILCQEQSTTAGACGVVSGEQSRWVLPGLFFFFFCVRSCRESSKEEGSQTFWCEIVGSAAFCLSRPNKRMTQIEALPLNQTTHCHVIREQVFFFPWASQSASVYNKPPIQRRKKGKQAALNKAYAHNTWRARKIYMLYLRC